MLIITLLRLVKPLVGGFGQWSSPHMLMLFVDGPVQHVQGVGSIPEETAESQVCPPVPGLPMGRKSSGFIGTLQSQGSKFWMVSLPSLPVEGALTADPYSRVGASLERKEGAPPVKAPQ